MIATKDRPLYSASIGKKLVMSITGLFLCSFLLIHLSGNFLLLKSDGGEAFNAYANFMSTSPLIRIMEIVLVMGVGFHVFFAIKLIRENAQARPQKYAYSQPLKNSSLFSQIMGPSGMVILLFLILHLVNFFAKHRFGDPGETMYETVRNTFECWYYVLFYVLCMVLLSFHLNHGFQSAFQTLGFNKPKSLIHKRIKQLGTLFAVAICVGYAVIPLFFFIKVTIG